MRPLSRGEIFQRFPWLSDRDRLMITSTDMDGLLSAAFLHHHLGWRPAGYYDGDTLWHSPLAREQRHRLVWVDLDISRSNIPSIGRHIMTTTGPLPEALASCCNPNLLVGVGVDAYPRKYPCIALCTRCRSLPGSTMRPNSVW